MRIPRRSGVCWRRSTTESNRWSRAPVLLRERIHRQSIRPARSPNESSLICSRSALGHRGTAAESLDSCRASALHRPPLKERDCRLVVPVGDRTKGLCSLPIKSRNADVIVAVVGGGGKVQLYRQLDQGNDS